MQRLDEWGRADHLDRAPAPTAGPESSPARSRDWRAATRSCGFKLTAGKNAKLKSFTVKLPRGLSFVRHRVHGRLKLLGVALKGAKVKSLSLKRGTLLVTLRAPVNTLSAKIGPRALKESPALRSAARHHQLKPLRLTVVLTNTAGKLTTSTLPLKTASHSRYGPISDRSASLRRSLADAR